MTKKLELWTIYKHPSDYPNEFVARKFILDKPTSEIKTSDTIETLRLLLPMGLTRVERNDGDDPVIVETWM